MKSLLAGLCAVCLTAMSTRSEDRAVRTYLSHERVDQGLEIHVSDGTIRMVPMIGNAVEVNFQPLETTSAFSSYALASRNAAPFSLTETDDALILRADAIEVILIKNPVTLVFRSGGEELLREASGYTVLDRGGAFRFKLDENEMIFGAGSRALGRMNRRGERFDLYNSASYSYEYTSRLMYYSMPAVVSSKKYMLVIDNAARGYVDIDSRGDGILEFGAVSGRMSYIVIAGDTWEQLARNTAETTGFQPMLPRWALGHITSRMGYHSREEVEDVVDRHVEDAIPLDAVILDLFWFGPSIFGTMGNLDWDREAFPEPEEMVASLKHRGIKTILITEPLVLTESANWESAVSNRALAVNETGQPYTFDSFFGKAALIDMFSPAARDWMWSFYRKHTKTGIAGWWGDLGEPETHPDDILHASGRGEELHNAFGHQWARLVYEGYQRDFAGQRPFILMRSGFVGTQRYGILPWSGDVKRSWGGLRPQIELSLQMGMQGIGYMHSDLGGFAGDNRDPELYIRWMQYGVFQPIYRPHGHEEVPPEPVFWDKETKDIVRRYIELRYRMLPYNYTLMFENATRGMPLMRPLMYESEDPELHDITTAFMWGDAFLVAPVLEPGVKEMNVPLPAGQIWYDFWTDLKYEGGKPAAVAVTRENIPVFVRAGSFIPMTGPLKNTEAYDGSELQVHYYYSPSQEEASGKIYDDDGVSPGSFTSNAYELIHLTALKQDGALGIRFESNGGDYPGKPLFRKIRLTVHGLEAIPEHVQINGVPHDGVVRDTETGRITVDFTLRTSPVRITFLSGSMKD